MDKTLVGVAITIGSIIGGAIPMLWGAGIFSISSLIFSGLGALAALYVAYKLSA